MANKNQIDALIAAEASHSVIRLKGQIAEAEATLVIMRAKLEIAKAQAIAAKVESS